MLNSRLTNHSNKLISSLGSETISAPSNSLGTEEKMVLIELKT